MVRKTTQKLIMAALFAALCCIATMIIHFPTPGTGGYIHLGDAFVILAGVMLGPVYGAAAAGIGSMLADVLSGYSHYALPTLIIKALAALVAALIYTALRKVKLNRVLSVIIGGAAAAVVVAGGYFAIESTMLGYGMGALASVPANLLQGGAGVVISAILAPVLAKLPLVKDFLQ